MTLLQIHLLMLALGVVAALVISGSKIFKHPDADANFTAENTQQPLIGFLAFLVVAASPLIRFSNDVLTHVELLKQSLVMSGIGLLALLLFVLLQKPSSNKRQENTNQKLQPLSQTNTLEEAKMEVDNSIQGQKDMQSNLDERATGIDGQLSLGQAANDHDQPKADSSNLAFLASLDRLMEDNKSTNATRSEQQPLNESLDLSDTEEQYANLISNSNNTNNNDIELPENEDWVSELEGLVNLDESLVLADEQPTYQDLEDELPIIDGELLYAELEADSAMDFGDDMTGEYAHPDGFEPSSPETLEEALMIGKDQASGVQKHIDELNDKLTELQVVQQELTDEKLKSQLTSAQMIVKRDELLSHEASARHAAEAVITAQRSMLDQSKNQQLKIGHLLLKERKRIELYRVDAERSKATARQAAALARKAAVATQTIKDIAKREQQARLRSQQSAKRAVDIARNAISALAAEERKNTTINH
jgi:hypothetical protein